MTMTCVHGVMGQMDGSRGGRTEEEEEGDEAGWGPSPCGVTGISWLLVGRPQTDCRGSQGCHVEEL